MPTNIKEEPINQGLDSYQLGKQIAMIRKRRGLTQIQLADCIGINQKLLSSYEVGRITLSAEMLLRLAKALRVTTDEILGISDTNSIEENPSLKVMKRLLKIERLPLAQQKALLKNIDMFLKAAETE